MTEESKVKPKVPFWSEDQFSQTYLKGRIETFTYRIPFNPTVFSFNDTDPNTPNVPFNISFNIAPTFPEIHTEDIFVVPKGCAVIDVIAIGAPGELFQLQQYREPNPATGTVGGFNPTNIVNPIAMAGPNAIRPPVIYNKLKELDRVVVTAPAGTFITFVVKYK